MEAAEGDKRSGSRISEAEKKVGISRPARKTGKKKREIGGTPVENQPSCRGTMQKNDQAWHLRWRGAKKNCHKKKKKSPPCTANMTKKEKPFTSSTWRVPREREKSDNYI